ncbi:MAG: hypothetical protein JWQ96_3232 [Segetibacter sp.]|nr:hypothetical protein [Segetibacter sp.]
MNLYFEFEERRVTAAVDWPEDRDTIVVHVTDAVIARDLPTDLFFEIERGNKVTFVIEDLDNKRLIDLQKVISRRLQEFANKS